MREKIGKTGDRAIVLAGRIFYRSVSIIPFAIGIAAGSALLSALRIGDLLSVAVTAIGTVLCFALVWYLWRPERHLRELD